MRPGQIRPADVVDVEQIGYNSWRLCGALTFDTVTDLVDAMPEHELGAQLKFELSGLTKVDLSLIHISEPTRPY